MAKQDPIPAPAPATSNGASVFSDVTKQIKERLDLAIQNQKMTHLQEAHNQRLNIEIAQAEASSVLENNSARIKNEKEQLGIEIEKAKAVNEGLLVQDQDPTVPQDPARYVNNGLAEAQQRLKARLERNGMASSPESQKTNELFMEQLNAATVEAFEEKSLKRAPAGQFGRLAGSILNLIPGLELGTAVFGGKMSAEERSAFLASNVYKTSPLVRTELDDLLDRDKLAGGYSSNARRRLRTMPATAALTDGNSLMIDTAYNTRLEIGQALAFNPVTKSTFSSESVVGRSINAFESMGATLLDLKESLEGDNVNESVALFEKSVMEDQRMSALVDEYINNGGSLDNLTKNIQNAQALIQTDYIGKDIDPNAPGFNKTQAEFIMAKRASANEYSKILTNYLDDVAKRASFNPRVKKSQEKAETKDQFAQMVKDEELNVPAVAKRLKAHPTLRAEMIETVLSRFPEKQRAELRKRIEYILNRAEYEPAFNK